MSTSPKLVIDNLIIMRNRQVLVHHFSHSFYAGDIVALVGNNGSGKTTLLKTLAGLNPSLERNIWLDNFDLFHLSSQKRALFISLLQQLAPDQPYCTARHRIVHGLMPTMGFDIFFDQAVQSLVDQVAKRLGITHLLDRVLSHLSGGEQRMVHIAKCLIQPQTSLLLLDEPSVFLDFAQQKNLLRCLKEEAQKGRVVIFASHDSGFIKQSSHRVLSIKHQRIEVLE